VLIEDLQAADTNMINTLDEASAFIAEVGCPAVAGMFDFHNCGDETLPWEQLIQRHGGLIQHVHLNTPEGGYPMHVDPAYLAATAGFLDEVEAALAGD
jgi:hypothetical protein